MPAEPRWPSYSHDTIWRLPSAGGAVLRIESRLLGLPPLFRPPLLPPTPRPPGVRPPGVRQERGEPLRDLFQRRGRVCPRPDQRQEALLKVIQRRADVGDGACRILLVWPHRPR